MPYELSFNKFLVLQDETRYINECCYGGDVVGQLLLPVIEQRFQDVQFNQEDWGWFIWFRRGPASLAIDIFCDDPKAGEFRIHLTSRVKRLFLPDPVRDMPELDEVKDLVLAKLEEWLGGKCQIARLDKNHMPTDDAA